MAEDGRLGKDGHSLVDSTSLDAAAGQPSVHRQTVYKLDLGTWRQRPAMPRFPSKASADEMPAGVSCRTGGEERHGIGIPQQHLLNQRLDEVRHGLRAATTLHRRRRVNPNLPFEAGLRDG